MAETGEAIAVRQSSRSAIVVARDTEEGRAFLQQRLAQFTLLILKIGVGFFVLANTVAALAGAPLSRVVTLLGNQAHVFLLLMSGGVVVLCRRVRLSQRALFWLDVGMMIAFGLAQGVMGYHCPQAAHPALQGPVVTAANSMPMFTATMVILVGRAIVVPSTVRHTLLVSVAGALPIFVAAHLLHMDYPVGSLGQTTLQQTIGGFAWLGTAVALATIASRTVYMLHAQVRDAAELGQYTLAEKIGEGGMGTVYKAHHALLRRPTAVKLLRRDTAGANSLSRFEREVQLTSRLTHPNTVAIYDYGRTEDGTFYYAMEYLEGMNLEELVALDGPQEPSRVVHILAQVAGALAEAHAIGLVHRDVKPANIILCERGGIPDVAKVVDFGLARELDASAETAALTASAANTLLGTPLYISPEAITAPERIDGRADLYALGAVGYFLLAGAPPFEARTVFEACAHHLHSTVVKPSVKLGKPLPEDLEALLLRCLAKDPGARPQSARELRGLFAELGVEPWNDERARARQAELRTQRPELRSAVHEKSATQLAMTVDLRQRAADDER